MLEYYRFKVVNDLFAQGKPEEAMLQLKKLQTRYVALCEDNARLRNQVREFEDILYFARNFVFDGTFYWLNTGSIKQGPFCPHCYNRDGQVVRIADATPKACPVCSETFTEAQRNSLGTMHGRSAALALRQEQIIDPMTSLEALAKHAQKHKPLPKASMAPQERKKAIILHFSR